MFICFWHHKSLWQKWHYTWFTLVSTWLIILIWVSNSRIRSTADLTSEFVDVSTPNPTSLCWASAICLLILWFPTAGMKILRVSLYVINLLRTISPSYRLWAQNVMVHVAFEKKRDTGSIPLGGRKTGKVPLQRECRMHTCHRPPKYGRTYDLKWSTKSTFERECE